MHLTSSYISSSHLVSSAAPFVRDGDDSDQKPYSPTSANMVDKIPMNTPPNVKVQRMTNSSGFRDIDSSGGPTTPSSSIGSTGSGNLGGPVLRPIDSVDVARDTTGLPYNNLPKSKDKDYSYLFMAALIFGLAWLASKGFFSFLESFKKGIAD